MKKINRNQRNLLEGEMSRYRVELLQNQTYNFQKKIKDLGDEAAKVKENTYKNINALLSEPRSMEMDGRRLAISNMQDVYDYFKPHMGRPFLDIDKEEGPANHFMMYAIAKGVKREDLAAYIENPKSDKVKDTVKQLNVLRDDFIKMIKSEDQKQAEDIVVDYLKAVEKETPKLFGEAKDVDGIKKNLYGLYALGDPESLLKTDHHKNSELVENVEKKLKEANANISLASMYQGVTLLRGVAESIKKDDLKDEASLRKGNMGESTKFYSAFHAYDKFREGLEKENYSLTKASEDYAKIKDEVAQTQERIGKATSMGWRNFDRKSLDRHQPRDNDEVDIAKGLLEEMKASKRTTFMGRIQKPSDEFVAVGKTLNRYINSHNDKLKMDRGNLNQLRADCEKYLEDHNPYSPQGRERYKLITKVLTYADAQLAAMPDTARHVRQDEVIKQFVDAEKVGADQAKISGIPAAPPMPGTKAKTTVERRTELAQTTLTKFKSRAGYIAGDDQIEEFLKGVGRNFSEVEKGAQKGPMADKNTIKHYREELAKLQIYELLRSEYKKDTQNFHGEIADQIRQGKLDELVRGMGKMPFNDKYLREFDHYRKYEVKDGQRLEVKDGQQLDTNGNNLKDFLEAKPSEFLKSIQEENSKKEAAPENKEAKKVAENPNKQSENNKNVEQEAQVIV